MQGALSEKKAIHVNYRLVRSIKRIAAFRDLNYASLQCREICEEELCAQQPHLLWSAIPARRAHGIVSTYYEAPTDSGIDRFPWKAAH